MKVTSTQRKRKLAKAKQKYREKVANESPNAKRTRLEIARQKYKEKQQHSSQNESENDAVTIFNIKIKHICK